MGRQSEARPFLVLTGASRLDQTTLQYGFGRHSAQTGDLYLSFSAHGASATAEREACRVFDRLVDERNAAAGRTIVFRGAFRRFTSEIFYDVYLNSRAGIDEDNLAPFCHELGAAAGARVNALAALNFATESIRAPLRQAGLIRNADFAMFRPVLAALQCAYAGSLDACLSLDVSAGSQQHPELVHELYLERTPLEMVLLNRLLANSVNSRAARGTLYRDSPAFLGPVDPGEMTWALGALEASGWIERPAHDDLYGGFAAARGPKLRKLSSKDALAL